MISIVRNRLIGKAVSLAMIFTVIAPCFTINNVYADDLPPVPSTANTAIFNLKNNTDYISFVGVGKGVKVEVKTNETGGSALIAPFNIGPSGSAYAAISSIPGLSSDGGEVYVTFTNEAGTQSQSATVSYGAEADGPSVELRTTSDIGGNNKIAVAHKGNSFYVSVFVGGYANLSSVNIPIHFDQNKVRLVRLNGTNDLSGAYTKENVPGLNAFDVSFGNAAVITDNYIVNNNMGLVQVGINYNTDVSSITALVNKTRFITMRFLVVDDGPIDLRFTKTGEGAKTAGFIAYEPTGLEGNIKYTYTEPTLTKTGWSIIDVMSRGMLTYTKNTNITPNTDTAVIRGLLAGDVVEVYSSDTNTGFDDAGLPANKAPVANGTVGAGGSITFDAINNIPFGADTYLYFVIKYSATGEQTKALMLAYGALGNNLLEFEYYDLTTGIQIDENDDITTGTDFLVKVFLTIDKDMFEDEIPKIRFINLPIHFDSTKVRIVDIDGGNNNYIKDRENGNTLTSAQLVNGGMGVQWGDDMLQGGNPAMILVVNGDSSHPYINNSTGLIKIAAFSYAPYLIPSVNDDGRSHILTIKMRAIDEGDPGLRYAYWKDVPEGTPDEKHGNYYDVNSPNGASFSYEGATWDYEQDSVLEVQPDIRVSGNVIVGEEVYGDYILTLNAVPNTTNYSNKNNYPASNVTDGAVVFYSYNSTMPNSVGYLEPGFDVCKDPLDNDLFDGNGNLYEGNTITMKIYDYDSGSGEKIGEPVYTAVIGVGETMPVNVIYQIMLGSGIGVSSAGLRYIAEYEVVAGAFAPQTIERKIAVKYQIGDTDFNGVVTVTDIGMIRRYMSLGYADLVIANKPSEGVFKYVANADKDAQGNVTVTDIGAIRRHMSNVSIIQQEYSLDF